jgi:phenylpropionate dioxygenase-like ring-hydroxylating dioxygenase large terminal subunit
MVVLILLLLTSSIAHVAGFVSNRLAIVKRSSSIVRSTPYEKFDYSAQWYPVALARDVIHSKPYLVTLFDVDYVITRIPSNSKPKRRKRRVSLESYEDETVYAVIDRCPHKSASLSEGLVVKHADEHIPRFQCAYHGWMFDGKNGKCVMVPQSPDSENYGTRADITAVPALIQQGIIYLYPYGGLEEALTKPLPPRLVGFDQQESHGKAMFWVMRDLDVDWTIIIDNFLDPDHGLFAHQVPWLDLGSASQDHHMLVKEKFSAESFILRTVVDHCPKFSSTKEQNENTMRSDVELKKAVTTLHYPSHWVTGAAEVLDGDAIDADDEIANFTPFVECKISPVGTGRSRLILFFTLPFQYPSWLPLPFHFLGPIFLNNFLDDDTHLLATTQKYVLEAEAKSLRTNTKGVGHRSLSVLRSPSDLVFKRLYKFFDESLPRVPNRKDVLLNNYLSASKVPTPPRTQTLDRYKQHTKISPDSLSLVQKCKAIRRLSKVCIAMLATKVIISSRQMSVRGVKGAAACFLMAVISLVTSIKLEEAFHFSFPESRRDRSLAKIDSLWKQH